MNLLAIITARAGSKRLPEKNTRMCAGRPLVEWTLRAAWSSTYVDSCCVSTDDPKVVTIVVNNGITVPWMRPPELAQDDTPSWKVVEHALMRQKTMPQHFVLLQPTSPCRTGDDIDHAWTIFRSWDGSRAVVAVRDHEQTASGAIYMLNSASFLADPTHSFMPPSTIWLPLPRGHSIDVDTAADLHAADLFLRSI